MSGNLVRTLLATAGRSPARRALRQGDDDLTWEELDALSARVAGLLRQHGVEPGDRVGMMLPNVLEFPVAYYGVLRGGALVVPLNVLFKRREVAFTLRDAEAEVLFAWHAFAEEAEAGAQEAGCGVIRVQPGDFGALPAEADPLRDGDRQTEAAVILYTSGTTGTPKGAVLTHANLTRNADASRRIFALEERSVTLGVLPLFHSFGQTCALNATVAAGGSLTLLPRFDAGGALEAIERDRVTHFEGVPTMYGALLNHAERDRFDTSSLEVCVSGGASLPVELLRSFERAFGCPILEGYGLSETSPVASFNHHGRTRKPGSIGTPIEGVEMKVVDEQGVALPAGEVGEIAIRGHNIMKEYWRRPDATAAAISPDGWFRTGDLARIDDDGYFFIVDRKKDLIIRGGLNVYPREIEEVLYEHEAVREAAVIGIPHPELGEEVVAVVVLKDGREVNEEELCAFVKELLAAYKYPRRIWFVDELPKTATGKILKREIRVPAEAGA